MLAEPLFHMLFNIYDKLHLKLTNNFRIVTRRTSVNSIPCTCLKFIQLYFVFKGLTRSSTIEDNIGRTMPALEIFSMAMKFLQRHLLKTLNNQTTGIDEENIQYVITVPAIWNDHAKQFMRETAARVSVLYITNNNVKYPI